MGYFDAQRFAGGRVKLEVPLAKRAIAANIAKPLGIDDAFAALAMNEIVTENMANAARVHAMEQGKTVENYTVIAFGGAAPLHAARLAAKLGVTRVVVPLGASVGSALGFLTAPVAFQSVRSWYTALNELDLARTNRLLAEMEKQAAAVVRAAVKDQPLTVIRVAYMRYTGQGHEIPIELPAGNLTARDVPGIARRFTESYEELYARVIPDLAVEIMSWSVTAAIRSKPAPRARAVAKRTAARSSTQRRVFEATQEKWRDVPTYPRTQLTAGMFIKGPALITEDQTTIVVTADFDAHVNALGYLVLDKRKRT
jgi:N-methylhydantoinase A